MNAIKLILVGLICGFSTTSFANDDVKLLGNSSGDIVIPSASDKPLDNKGIRTAIVNGITVQFQYDSLGRLVKEAYPTNTGSYSYDPAGNRITTVAQ